MEDLKRYDLDEYPNLMSTIKEVLEIDPRPAYKNQESANYGFQLYDLNILWSLDNSNIIVESIHKET
jgi:hypothetical protein